MPGKAEVPITAAMDVAAGSLSLPRRPAGTRHPTGAAWIPPSERKLSPRPPSEMAQARPRRGARQTAARASVEAGQRFRDVLAWLRGL